MGYDMYSNDGEERYFRYNIWGMGEARNALDALGMLDIAFRPTWPEAKDFGFEVAANGRVPELCGLVEALDAQRGDRECPAGTDPDAWARMLAYQDANTGLVDGEAETPAGIPAFKLGSNDGWLVTPREIESALAALGDRDQEAVAEITGLDNEGVGYFMDFVGYLRDCRGSGFRVY